MTSPTKRFVLAYIIENEVKAERNLSLRRTLQGQRDRLLNAAVPSQLDRTELGNRAKREIEPTATRWRSILNR